MLLCGNSAGKQLIAPYETLKAIHIVNIYRGSVFFMNKSRQGGSYEGRRGHGKGFERYPVKLGQELEVYITECSPKGEGITKVQGLVVYVANAKPGNHVKIKISKIVGQTAKAEIVE